MKKYICIPILFCLLILSSCTKSAQEIQAPSKVDLLFNQLKSEPKFLEYLNTIKSTMDIMKQNLATTKLSDSTLLRNKNFNLYEKSEKLKFSGIEKIQENNKKINELFNYLSKKYDLLNTLPKDELELLYKKAHAFYFKSKIKHTI